MNKKTGTGRPLRFYDNRQKYLAFVNTCNEKWKVAQRAARELAHCRPVPPAFRLFDAGMGDGTVLAHLMRAMHRRFPSIPFFIVGKEISLEDVRLSMEKLPDRFVEHPASVVVLTNLNYADAPWLMPRDPARAAQINWQEISLVGTSSFEFGEQLRDLDDLMVDGWQVKTSPKTGNPMFVKPTVMVIHRADHQFVLNQVLPKKGAAAGDYDLVLAAQPWRASTSAQFKVDKILEPLSRSLRKGGRLLAVQSYGDDPGLELVNEIWPDENPFQIDRQLLVSTLKEKLGTDGFQFLVDPLDDANSLFEYRMHTLPHELAEAIGTSTLFAAWNAAVYVAQIEEERAEKILTNGDYIEATRRILKKHDGLWFKDESFVVSKLG
ncbi:hypothetical protein MNBD_ALPHA06-769 [hydrothermal vent metagenome]|uniref:Uncharacterized protein n=1 Tax=hydrothermal vent metagenome TaxID=652676 RepID=A0A3B0SUL0_9ZZZZ